LQVDNIEEHNALNLVADLSTLISTHYEGFCLVIEPYPEENKGTLSIPDPMM
jgi:hypothetical protein